MDDGSVEIGMKHYLEEAIVDFGEDLDERELSSPASPFLFGVDPNCVPLSEDIKDVFFIASTQNHYMLQQKVVPISIYQLRF